jgi:hypothetical protein
MSSAHAAVVWDESVSGDLSNDRLNPTPINLSAGVNSLIGNVGVVTGTNLDIDYITINVPVGDRLSGLILNSYVGDDGTSFIGMENGSQITVPTTAFTAAGLQGWGHFGPDTSNQVGFDMLPNMSLSSLGSSGFTIPVPNGKYSFWIQQRDGFPTDYQFDFVVTPPPTGDYNGDHVVDAADYTVWRDTLGQTIPAGTGADGNDNGTVDAADYTFWLSHFGAAAPAAGHGVAVPEPATCVLVFGGLPLIARRLSRS